MHVYTWHLGRRLGGMFFQFYVGVWECSVSRAASPTSVCSSQLRYFVEDLVKPRGLECWKASKQLVLCMVCAESGSKELLFRLEYGKINADWVCDCSLSCAIYANPQKNPLHQRLPERLLSQPHQMAVSGLPCVLIHMYNLFDALFPPITQ